MPYASEFTSEGRGLVFTGTEVVTAHDILSAKKSLDAGKLKNINWAICDLREITEIKVTSDEIRVIANMDKDLARIVPGAFVALVAPRADIYGLSRMWQTLVEDTGWTVAIFLSREEAEMWVRGRVG